ncbi:hypothetical protein BJX62DRAFT_236284 [Aspergillus germanicus]
MDPVTAIGLVSGIITIVESSTKILSGAREVYDSGHGSTAENRSLASITKEMQDLSSRLILPERTDNHASPFEEAISVLAAECKAIADVIIALLAKMTASNSVKSRRQSLWAAARSVWYQKDKEELLNRLDRCRAQSNLHLDDLNREYNVFARLASQEQTLRLQDLTKKDIRLYAQRQLQAFSHADGHDALVTAIANRASGVFLWVSIVTNTILDLLEDGFTVSTVTRELNALPPAGDAQGGVSHVCDDQGEDSSCADRAACPTSNHGVRATAKVEHAPFPFLETLAAIMLEKGMKDWPCPGTNQIWAPSTWNHFHHYSTAVGPEQKPVRVFEVASPMLLSALEGAGDYVCWKVPQDQALTNTPLKCGLLMGLIGFGARPGSLRVPLVLLENGLAPDTVIHLGYGSLFGNVARSLTFWQGLIYYIVRAADNITDSEACDLLGEVVQAFLENGADPALHISTRSQVKRMGWGIEPVMRSPELDVSVSFDGTLAVIPSIGYSLHEFIVSRGEVITLSDLVDFWRPKNGDAILGLIQQIRPGSCSVKHVSDDLLESKIVADRETGTAVERQSDLNIGVDAAADTLRSWPPIVITGSGREIAIVIFAGIMLAITAIWLQGIE